MALVTLQPTANQTPDATLGGLAVTTISNTGHASTSTVAVGGASTTKSARWFTFQTVSGQIRLLTLKIDHTSNGTLTGLSPFNSFDVEYSLNNGSSWLSAVTRSGFTGSQGPTTFSVALSVAQNLTQVQVRANYFATGSDVDDSASVTATIANIKLEVETLDNHLLLMM